MLLFEVRYTRDVILVNRNSSTDKRVMNESLTRVTINLRQSFKCVSIHKFPIQFIYALFFRCLSVPQKGIKMEEEKPYRFWKSGTYLRSNFDTSTFFFLPGEVQWRQNSMTSCDGVFSSLSCCVAAEIQFDWILMMVTGIHLLSDVR